MNISDDTIEILKNYSTINSSLLFKKGSVISTISPLKNVFAVAKIEESFPKDFAIFDLNKILVKMSLYKDFDLNFDEDRLVVESKDGNNRSEIKYCSPSVITTPPDKKISVDEPDVEFSLPQNILELQLKNAGSSGSPNFVFKGEDGKVKMIATDVKDDSSDKNVSVIGKTDKNFSIVMKVENFKILPGSYDIEIAKKGIAKFTHESKKIQYFIAIESASSSFE